MTNRQECDLILWHVSGTLEPAQAARFERHLKTCDRCRLDAETFASIMRSLKRQSPTDHTAPEEKSAPEERTPIHLSKNQATAAAPRPWRRPAAAALIMLSAAGLIATLLYLSRTPGIQESPPRILTGIQTIVLSAPLRGGPTTPRLVAPGPWEIWMILPFGSPRGEWDVSITREDNLQVDSTTLAPDIEGAGNLRLLLGSLPGTGRYRLVARSRETPADPPVVYPFDVVPRTANPAP